MKKIAILGLCFAGSVAAFAQSSVVKDVERQMKASPEKYPALLETLKPAFTDPESSQEAATFFVAGKGGFDYFDQLDTFKKIGKEVDDKSMGRAIIDAYGYFRQALPLDSMPDAKGKVKPKYSKDIFKIINSHYNDYDKAARYMWEAKDFDGAFEAWQVFVDLPNDPILGANAPKALPDSSIAEVHYNQALAAWQSNNFENAIKAFDNALAKGYHKKQLYDYAIAVAYNMHNPDLMAHYAELAYPIYGHEDDKYIGYIINAKIKAEKYDEAQSMLEKYIAEDPNNAQNYYVLGILYDSQNNFEKALENYEKAVKLDPNNAQALLQYGRQISNKAYTIEDESGKLSPAEYNKVREEVINPIFRESVPYLEKAYQLDPENTRNALNLLRNIYYNLNDADNLKRIEEEMQK